MASLQTSPRRLPGACLAALLLGVAVPAWGAQVTRGPYLQLASDHSITVVWRTDVAGVGRVRFGQSLGNLGAAVAESASSQTHAIRLDGLTAATRYAYALDLDGTQLVAGPELTFRTYPQPGSTEPFRFFAWGDSGDGSTAQLRLAATLAGQVGQPAFALHLGDLVYPDGSAANYDPRFFTPYQPLLSHLVIWPTIGEHDLISDNGASYANAFYLPANNPQSSPLYYSFDYGNAHFVALATDGVSYANGSPQLQWLRNDLSNSTATWKFVFFHRPPYSGGTSPDDANVQGNIVPVLDQSNVDLVFSGHSHVLERTFLLSGGTIAQGDPGSYTKLSSTTPGTLYVVSGAGGQLGPLATPGYRRMAFQQGNVNGVVVIDVAGLVARGYFLQTDGTVQDLFTLSKGADSDPPQVIGFQGGPSNTQLKLSFDEPVAADGGIHSADTLANYVISPPVAVRAAGVGPDQRTVTLTTAPQDAGTYTLTLSGIQDRANPPNTMNPTQVIYLLGVADGGTDGGTGPSEGPGGVGGPSGSPGPGACGCRTRGAQGALFGGLLLLGLIAARRREPRR